MNSLNQNNQKNLFWCKSCLNFSTRNRIKFDDRGFCNACTWSEEKKIIDWEKRQDTFKELIKSIKKTNRQEFNLIIPVSGGKDGSYVTHIMREKYKLNPLCVTVNPPLRTSIGHENLENFKKSGIALIEINPPYEALKKINKKGLIEQGRPLYGWTTSIFTGVVRIANAFNIDLIMYGEDGEVEYGGDSSSKNIPFFNYEYIKKVYLESSSKDSLNELNDNSKYFWNYDENKCKNLKLSHWSYFESWDPYRNYLVAKEHMGLKEKDIQNTGTFTNFAQNDTKLYDLHTFFMYIKFGFGRCTQDVGIDIRRGAMTREQGIQLVNMFDNYFPKEYLEEYLKYYSMTENQFIEVLDKHTNKELFSRNGLKWEPKFLIQ